VRWAADVLNEWLLLPRQMRWIAWSIIGLAAAALVFRIVVFARKGT
jgi:hypothetical protein